MDWVLMYLMMTFAGAMVHTGMHTTGPFMDEEACRAYADETWLTTDWSKEEDGRNFYDSDNIIHHLEHNKSNMAVFYTCVKIRDPEKWRE